MKKAFLILLLSFIPGLGTSMSLEFFEKANRLYEKGQYDSAVTYYEKIVSMGLHDARVYFNLGNAHFRKKDLGMAILNFELAQKLDPDDKDIRANLRFAHAATVDKIPPRKRELFEKLLFKLHSLLSISVQSVLFLVIIYVLSIIFILYFNLHIRFRSTLSFLGVICLVFFLGLSTSFFYKIYQERNFREAIVLSDRVNAKNEPDGANVLFSVHEGTRFRLNRKVGEWYFASLENGVSGWVYEGDLGIIEIP